MLFLTPLRASTLIRAARDFFPHTEPMGHRALKAGLSGVGGQWAGATSLFQHSDLLPPRHGLE